MNQKKNEEQHDARKSNWQFRNLGGRIKKKKRSKIKPARKTQK